MDPTANLREQLAISNYLVSGRHSAEDKEIAGERLAELVLSLNNWIQNGGFLPKDWQDKVVTRY